MAKCKDCGAAIQWAVSLSGHWRPFDLEPVISADPSVRMFRIFQYDGQPVSQVAPRGSLFGHRFACHQETCSKRKDRLCSV